MTSPAPADCKICCPAGWSVNVDQVPDEDCPIHGRFQPCGEAPIGLVTNCRVMRCQSEGCAMSRHEEVVSLDDLRTSPAPASQPTPTEADREAALVALSLNGLRYEDMPDGQRWDVDAVAQALADQRAELVARYEADLSWQWGVKHHQGIREETSERNARESFAEMSQRRRRYDVVAPSLVRRRIGTWEPAPDEVGQ